MGDLGVSRRRVLAALGASGLGGFAGCSATTGDGSTPADGEGAPSGRGGTGTEATPESDPPGDVFVTPDGSDAGDGTADSPVGSIQQGVDVAGPGDTVYVDSGEYSERLVIDEGGAPGAPLTITGPPDAVVRGTLEYTMLRINASHVHLTGLTVDGLLNPSAPDDPKAYQRGRLVWAHPPEGSSEYLRDVVVAPHGIGNARNELVRFQRTVGGEIGPFRVIGPAGAEWVLTGEPDRHYGEIAYIGTPRNGIPSAPWPGDDLSRNIRVHHIDNSAGYAHSQLVNSKPGTRDVTIEYCTDGGGSQNTESWDVGAISIDGYRNTVRWCRLLDVQGTAIKVKNVSTGSTHPPPEGVVHELPDAVRRSGTQNAIYGNEIRGQDANAVVYGGFWPENSRPSESQRFVCGNEYDPPTAGSPGTPCPDHLPESEEIGHTGGDSPWA